MIVTKIGDPPKPLTFADLNMGDPFFYGVALYMKIDNLTGYEAVHLTSGELVKFKPADIVRDANARVVVETLPEMDG